MLGWGGVGTGDSHARMCSGCWWCRVAELLATTNRMIELCTLIIASKNVKRTDELRTQLQETLDFLRMIELGLADELIARALEKFGALLAEGATMLSSLAKSKVFTNARFSKKMKLLVQEVHSENQHLVRRLSVHVRQDDEPLTHQPAPCVRACVECRRRC